MVCNNLKDLRKELERKISKSLVEDVAPIVKLNMVQAVNETVYDHYPAPKYPDIYDRRGTDGGLSDIENMVETIAGLTLGVKNETPFNTDYGGFSHLGGIGLDELIVYGDGYNGVNYDYTNSNGSNAYKDPRDFYARTIEILSRNKNHINKLRGGLRKEGLEVK